MNAPAGLAAALVRGLVAACPPRRRWSNEEEQELERRLAGGQPCAAIAAALDRPEVGVANRVRLLRGQRSRRFTPAKDGGA